MKYGGIIHDTKTTDDRFKTRLKDGLGTIFRTLTGNLNANVETFYTDCIYKLNHDEREVENLMKNQISVTSSDIKNFNETFQKHYIDD